MKKSLVVTATMLALATLVALGQTVTTVALPDLPANYKTQAVRTNADGIVVTGLTATGRLVMMFDGTWQSVTGIMRGEVAGKELNRNNLYLSRTTSLGKDLYFETFLDWNISGQIRAVNYGLKMSGGNLSDLCNDLGLSTVTNGAPIYSLRGPFPSQEGIYFVGKRLAPGSMGIYSLQLPYTFCRYTELFTTDINYQILQVWKDVDGSFIAERFPANPENLETEVVRYSSAGELTVLVSSNAGHNAKIVAAQCCTLVVDPNVPTFTVEYKGNDNRWHAVRGPTLDEVHVTTTQIAIAQPPNSQGKYLLLATGRYANVFDSLILVNTETKQSITVYDANDTLLTGVPPQTSLDPMMTDLDAKGNVYFGLPTYNGNTRVFVRSVVFPPPPTISSFVATPATVVAGDLATLSCKASGTVTSVTINGTPVDSNGNLVVKPTTTTTYACTVVGPGGTATATTTVTVTIPPPPLPPSIISFTADVFSITSGNSATLSWVTTGATAVSLDQGIGNVGAVSGSRVIVPTSTTTYTLTAISPGGSVTAKVTVTVIPAIPPAVISSVLTIMYQPQNGLAPGSRAILTGTQLTGLVNASPIILPPNVASDVPWPTKLAGTEVYVNGTPVPLFVAYTPANTMSSLVYFQVPNLAPGDYQLFVRRYDSSGVKAEIDSAATSLTIVATSPVVWRDFGDSSFPVIVQNLSQLGNDGLPILVTPKTPAKRGDILQLWMTGLGITNPTLPAGTSPTQLGQEYASATKFATPVPVKAFLKSSTDYYEVDLVYAVASPQYPGLFQVALRLRDNTPSGTLGLIMTQGNATIGQSLPDAMTIYVQ